MGQHWDEIFSSLWIQTDEPWRNNSENSLEKTYHMPSATCSDWVKYKIFFLKYLGKRPKVR